VTGSLFSGDGESESVVEGVVDGEEVSEADEFDDSLFDLEHAARKSDNAKITTSTSKNRFFLCK